MGLTPPARQASWNATAPNMLPWSVRAMAFIPPLAACSTSSSMWQAPSRRLYSEWRWRWTNSGGIYENTAEGAEMARDKPAEDAENANRGASGRSQVLATCMPKGDIGPELLF